MEITFNLGPQVFSPASNPEEDSEVLRALLVNLIRVNRIFLKYHPRTPPLYQAGVVYRRTKTWDAIPTMYEKRYGDCKSLTAALIAEYCNAGIEASPVFRFHTRPDGGKDFHILVQREGRWEDPSKILGMTAENSRYFMPQELRR